MSSLKILSNYRQSLFVNPLPISKIKNGELINNVFSYRMEPFIKFDIDTHWLVYDFIHDKIIQCPDDGLSSRFNIQKWSDDTGDLSREYVTDYVNSRLTGVMVECFLPNKKAILAIFDTQTYSLDEKDVLFYNIYHTYIRGSIFKKSIEEISRIEYNLNKKFHWVWFRKNSTSYLLPKVIERASSWIELNPDMEFNLWTNLEDVNELNDFFNNADITGEFRKRIVVRYKHETYAILKRFCEERLKINWSDYEEILNNKTDTASMILKTDPTRCAILYELGGWYSDFNDTYCFVPLKYIVDNTCDTKMYVGSDENRNFNNYILYSLKENAQWLENATQIFKNSFVLYKFLMNKDARIVDCINDSIKECGVELEGKTSCILVERILSVFYKFMPTLNTTIYAICNDLGIDIANIFIFDNQKIIFLFSQLFIREFPNSIITTTIQKEVKNIRNVTFDRRRKKLRVHYHDSANVQETSIEKTMVDDIKTLVVSSNTVYNLLFEISILSLLNLVNIGTYFQKNSKNVYQIPNCYVYDSFTFLTVMGHMGDGSSCGNSVYEYNEKSI